MEIQALEQARYEELKEKGLEGIEKDLKDEINGFKENMVDSIENMLDEEYDKNELEDLKWNLQELENLFRAKEEVKDEIYEYKELYKKYD